MSNWTKRDGEPRRPDGGRLRRRRRTSGGVPLHHPGAADTIYTASTKQARSLIARGYVEQGVPFSNEPNHSALVGVQEFHSAAGTDHIYTADAAEVSRLRQAGSGYADQGTVFTAIGQPAAGAGPIYRFHSAAFGDHLYTPDLTEGFSKNGYAYEGISWYSAVLLPGLSGDVVFDRSDALVFSDALTGAGTLTKRGTGTLTLSASNSMTGTTAIADGVLNVTGSLTGSADDGGAGCDADGNRDRRRRGSERHHSAGASAPPSARCPRPVR